jgi:hypothetical protein
MPLIVVDVWLYLSSWTEVEVLMEGLRKVRALTVFYAPNPQ